MNRLRISLTIVLAVLVMGMVVVPTTFASQQKDATMPGVNWVQPKNCTIRIYAPGATFKPGSSGSWQVTVKGETTTVISGTFVADSEGGFQTEYMAITDGWYTVSWSGLKNGRKVTGSEDFLVEGCPDVTNTPTPTATATNTPTATATNTPNPTPTPTDTPEPIVYKAFLPIAMVKYQQPCSRQVEFQYQQDVRVFDFERQEDARIIPYRQLLGLGQSVTHTMVDRMSVDRAFVEGPWYIVLDPSRYQWVISGTINGRPPAGPINFFNLSYGDCVYAIALTWDPPEGVLAQSSMTSDGGEKVSNDKWYWYDRVSGRIYSSKQTAIDAISK